MHTIYKFIAAFLLVTTVKAQDDRRSELIAEDNANFVGAKLQLSEGEKIFNQVLMKFKVKELEKAFKDDNLPSSRSFFKQKAEIEKSQVFKFIKEMPKGGALHVHEFAITSANWIISNITYRDNLHYCLMDNDETLVFAWFKPTGEHWKCSAWKKASEERKKQGSQKVDGLFKSFLSMETDDPAKKYPDSYAIWKSFEKIFTALISLINYEDLVEDYFYQGLQEFYNDKVQFMEVRAVLGSICANRFSSDCRPLDIVKTAEVFKKAADRFQEEHRDIWCGVRMIYAPHRHVDVNKVQEYLENYKKLKAALPDFIAGFDMVGHEDKGKPLSEFYKVLKKAKAETSNLEYFFHAGETNWQGTSTDENILDALLLDTKRIGHGFAMAKHPRFKSLAIAKKVPIEVNPISNQVLGMVADLRNHPVTPLIQEGFPIVISSDDPSLWGALGLSHDFYSTFMAMTSKTVDFRFLKQVVFNSVEYSALATSTDKKTSCLKMVEQKLDEFVRDKKILKKYKKIIGHSHHKGF